MKVVDLIEERKNEIRSSTNLYHHQYSYSSYSHGTSQFNTLHPNISMKILHTVRYIFHFVLTVRIFFKIKASEVVIIFFILMI